ncbi:MAG TPA: helix-turn-helix domain-containing protein, partial [Pyrinomonadaceae bacterium]|nr:helix-turn-helix domain-containing protein [Pyrinomonadaceae bacterium]
REDIPALVDHLMERFNRELGLNVNAISMDARRLLGTFDWPGNVRELENAICSAMIMSEGGTVTVQDLPPRIRGEAETTATAAGARDITKGTISDAVREATEKLEKMMIVSRLAEFNGNRTATADSLGISRKTLFNKMRQYGLGEGEIEDSYDRSN